MASRRYWWCSAATRSRSSFAQPEFSITSSAIEELLRYDGPSGAIVRIVRGETSLHGKTLRDGDRVFLMMHAANRDPDAFANPDQLDLTRDGRPHLAFGFGAHICLGFPLARTEGQVALPAVLNAFAQIEPAPDAAPAWINSLVFRGMHTLPVRVRPACAP